MARSIKAAIHGSVTGVDYWSGSSGLQHDAVDDVTVMPQWEVLDRELYAQYIRDRLGPAASSCPAWIWKSVGSRTPWLPTPCCSAPAVRRSNDPQARKRYRHGTGARDAGVHLVLGSDPGLHAFCRRHSFRVWMKSPHHGAALVRSWRELVALRRSFASAWGEAGLFLQAHVHGHEESLVLIANQGTHS